MTSANGGASVCELMRSTPLLKWVRAALPHLTNPSVASLLKRPREDHASSRVNLAPLATVMEGKRFCVLMQAGPYKQRKYMFN